ncbi:hypothetical protein ACFWWC_03750 [Streptomyces sp. NPDC058642]|uniref:hypothetical protein n=1 Tax=Streptomyces sp. NPDC058642 TaxID=3346572 RepID=UPI00364CCAF3
MSAYAEVLQALTADSRLEPSDAEQLLARLRKETGEELAEAVEKQLDGRFRRQAGDSETAFRNKKRVYAASMRVVQAIRRLGAAPVRPNFPHQRDNRSTS